jgi:hypothetical protein
MTKPKPPKMVKYCNKWCWYGEACEAVHAGREEILGSVSGEGVGFVTEEDVSRYNDCPHGGGKVQ